MAHASRRTIARVVAERLSTVGADPKAAMRELAAYLVAHNMTDDADVIINDIADELHTLTGRLVVEVTSAHALTDVVRQQLTAHFKDVAGAEDVELHETVDKELIGGLIAKTPSAELDLSVKSKLRQLTALAG